MRGKVGVSLRKHGAGGGNLPSETELDVGTARAFSILKRDTDVRVSVTLLPSGGFEMR